MENSYQKSIKVQIRENSKKETPIYKEKNKIIPIVLVCLSTYFYYSSLEENRKLNLLKRADKLYGSFNLLMASIITSILFSSIIRQKIHYLFLFSQIIIFWMLDLLYRKLVFIQTSLPTIVYLRNTIFITIFIETFLFSVKTIKSKDIFKLTCILIVIVLIIPFYFEIDSDRFELFPNLSLQSSNLSNNSNFSYIDFLEPNGEKESEKEKEKEEEKEKDKDKDKDKEKEKEKNGTIVDPYGDKYSEYEKRIKFKQKDGEKYCSIWPFGLSDKKIETDPTKDACKIRSPDTCYIELLLKDYTDFDTCENRANVKSKLVQFKRNTVPVNSNYIGYPDTTPFTLRDSAVGTFHYRVLGKLVDASKSENKPEVCVKFNKDGKGEVEIKINKNEKLLKERREKKKANPVKFENIVILYLDGLSRRHFYRSLPKTAKIVQEYYHLEKNKKEGFTSFQFLKYINFLGSTETNCIPMFYGSTKGETDKNSIVNEFKNKGYITASSSNQCHRELFLLMRLTKYKFHGFDHENIALFCDPNYNPPNNKQQTEVGIYARKRRCLYGKDTFEYVFEYGRKFLEAYKEDRKFLRLSFIDPHETSLAIVKYIDNSLSEFLLYLLENFKQSLSVFIVSDHGANFQAKEFNFLAGKDFRIERDLGTFFLIMSNDFEYNKENVVYNEEILVTPYDIHDTMSDMLNSNKSEYSVKGSSIFEKINGLNRTCDNFKKDYGNELFERCPCDAIKS
jgi:hypothetical protein